MPRKILHLDLDAFFCAVEELHNPSLQGKPFAVGGQADQRGVVASCSYPARLFGVRSAMPMSRAKRLCPDLIVVSSRHESYSKISEKFMALIDISPMIEKISIDEAFIDVTGSPDTLHKIAQELQSRVNTELNLPVSIGGATNKLVAKIANDWGKSRKAGSTPPNTITIIPPGDEASFLSPLPVQSLWGVGPKTAQKLSKIGITTIGALARTPVQSLEILLGSMAPELNQRAMGIDNRKIETEHDIKSVSNEITFFKDLTDETLLLQHLRHLSEKVGFRLRKAALAGMTVQIKLRWADFSTITRQKTLPSATNIDLEIYATAADLFKHNWPRGKPVRLIGVGVSSLTRPVHQYHLWDDNHHKKMKLSAAMDELHERYGKESILRGHLHHRDHLDDAQDDEGQ